MSTWSNLNLQNSASPLMEQLTFFHDYALMILIMITVMVSYMVFMLFFNNFSNRYLLHGQTIQVIKQFYQQLFYYLLLFLPYDYFIY